MKADVPSVAMGDIAFNLLIFFVILAKAQDDTHLKWEPAQADKLEEYRNSKVSVVIDAENKLHINGQEIGQAQLAGKIEEMLGDSPAVVLTEKEVYESAARDGELSPGLLASLRRLEEGSANHDVYLLLEWPGTSDPSSPPAPPELR